jgi:hypothetical protein
VNVIDKAIDAVFASDILGCERGLRSQSKKTHEVSVDNDIGVAGCECYNECFTIDVRKLVTLVLQQAGVDVTLPNKDDV